MVAAAIKVLGERKPKWAEKSFDEYLEALGPKQPDEPAILVKVSLDGTHSLKNEGEHDYALGTPEGLDSQNLSLLEMPQDFFYFIRGFHRGSFEIDQALPLYFYGMGILQVQTLFEVYLEDLLKSVYEWRPSLLPDAKTTLAYEQQLRNGDQAAAAELLEKSVRHAMRLPLLAVMKELREKLGFSELEPSVDEKLRRTTLLRNSIAHGGTVSERLAAAFPSEFPVGAILSPSQEMFDQAVTVFRECVFSLEQSRPDDLAARQEPAFGSS
jgi:hypothetical protein